MWKRSCVSRPIFALTAVLIYEVKAMAEYIELINRLRQEAEWESYLQPHSANETPKLLSEAADVIEKLSKERKKGKWISHLLDDGSFWANYCSECGVYLPYGLDWKPNGCPNCFADMRGET